MERTDYYTAAQVAEMTGMSVSRFKRWVEKGLLPPARKGPGGGYTETHIRRVRDIQEILDRNMTLEDIRDYFNPIHA